MKRRRGQRSEVPTEASGELLVGATGAPEGAAELLRLQEILRVGHAHF